MEPPLNPLPTDNLYKFLALGGLGLTIFTFWICSERIDTADLAFTEANQSLRLVSTETVILSNRVYHLEHEMDKLTNRASNLDFAVGPTNILTEGQTEILARIDKVRIELDNKRDEIEKALEELRRKDTESVNKIEIAKLAAGKASMAWYELRLIGTFGVILSFVGFVMWYLRVQVIQDRILRNEAEIHTSNHKKAISSKDAQAQ